MIGLLINQISFKQLNLSSIFKFSLNNHQNYQYEKCCAQHDVIMVSNFWWIESAAERAEKIKSAFI